jgi:hypothetical protein
VKALQLYTFEHVGCCRGVEEYYAAAKVNGVGELRRRDILDDRFLVTESVGTSGIAVIFKAQGLHDHNANTALKARYLRYESGPGFFRSFRREEEIGLTLKTSHVLKLIACMDQNADSSREQKTKETI